MLRTGSYIQSLGTYFCLSGRWCAWNGAIDKVLNIHIRVYHMRIFDVRVCGVNDDAQELEVFIAENYHEKIENLLSFRSFISGVQRLLTGPQRDAP